MDVTRTKRLGVALVLGGALLATSPRAEAKGLLKGFIANQASKTVQSVFGQRGLGFMNYKTVFTFKGQFVSMVRGPNAWTNSLLMKHQMRRQAQLFDQMAAARQRAAQLQRSTMMGARDSRPGIASRQDLPHPGSPATFREGPLNVLDGRAAGAQTGLVRAPVSPASHPPPM